MTTATPDHYHNTLLVIFDHNHVSHHDLPASVRGPRVERREELRKRDSTFFRPMNACSIMFVIMIIIEIDNVRISIIIIIEIHDVIHSMVVTFCCFSIALAVWDEEK